MPDKTTQKIKEKIPSIETMLNCLRLEVDESIVRDVSKTIYEALSQQQQEDDQEIVEVIMSVDKGDRIVIRDEILKAIAQKRGKVC